MYPEATHTAACPFRSSRFQISIIIGYNLTVNSGDNTFNWLIWDNISGAIFTIGLSIIKFLKNIKMFVIPFLSEVSDSEQQKKNSLYKR